MGPCEEPVGRADLVVALAVHARLPVGRGADDHGLQALDIPAVLDEVGGWPVQKRWVARRLPWVPKSLRA